MVLKAELNVHMTRKLRLSDRDGEKGGGGGGVWRWGTEEEDYIPITTTLSQPVTAPEWLTALTEMGGDGEPVKVS